MLRVRVICGTILAKWLEATRVDKLLDLLGIEHTTILWTILRISLTVCITIILVAVVNAIMRRLIHRRGQSGKNQNYTRLTRYALLIIIYAAAIINIVSGSAEKTVSTMIASSGILAVVLSVACQEPIGNLCSGVILMLSRPFQIGDLVRYLNADIMGTVEEITLRHTVIRTFENRRLIIPNSVLNGSSIENSNYGEKKVNVPLDFNVTYESDIEEAMRIISDVVLLHPDYQDYRTFEDIAKGTPQVEVYVRGFETSSINLRAWIWSRSSGAAITMKSDLLIQIRRRFMSSGIEFAYPHVTVVQNKE
jgi:small-conductance mechanosensitive channel